MKRVCESDFHRIRLCLGPDGRVAGYDGKPVTIAEVGGRLGREQPVLLSSFAAAKWRHSFGATKACCPTHTPVTTEPLPLELAGRDQRAAPILTAVRLPTRAA